MSAHKMNDAPVLDQLDGQWQKMAMLILWKLAKREQIKITAADMEQFRKEFEPGIPVMFTHGHSDSIDFQVIDEAQARVINQHQSTMRGTA